MSLMQITRLYTGYQDGFQLQDISFSVSKHELVGILGQNGCGKSTLLKAIAGLLPYRGKCEVQQRALESLSSRKRAGIVSWIPQIYGIDDDIEILDAVLMGCASKLPWYAKPTREMTLKARILLQSLGLDSYIGQTFGTLSSGQRQLCIWARTLMTDCSVLLMDEPDSALDFRNRRVLIEQALHWIREGDRCAVAILHDPQLALNSCQKILLMQAGKLFCTVYPDTDSPQTVQNALRSVFGAICLQKIPVPGGASQWVILEDRIG